jgi:ABC-type nitrate/sulfonate/bicarbonate transport system substrate-binding protein
MLRVIAGALLLSACASAPAPPANDPATLRVNVFRGSSNIPLYMAQETGAFRRRGLVVSLQFTPNSDEQRAGLAAGRFEIAQAAVDNAVAMVEVAKADAVIVAGGDGGINELMVRPEIARTTDLRGRAYAVDAPNTAYALIGRKILKDAGLNAPADYQLALAGGSEGRTRALDTPAAAATILNPPWSFIARERGAKSLGSTAQLFGPYQAQGLFVMRPWAAANPQVLERFLAAYIEGCRAAQDPARKELTLQVLARELKTERRIAELTYAELLSPGGLARDCALDQQGFRNVLALRAEMEGQWGGQPPAPGRFLDLSHYERALRHAAR